MKKTRFNQKSGRVFFLMLLLFLSNQLFATSTEDNSNITLIPDFVQEHQTLLWILGTLIFIMILILLTKHNEPLSE